MKSDLRTVFRGIGAGAAVVTGIVGSIVSILVIPGPIRMIAILCISICLIAWAGWQLVIIGMQKRKTNQVLARSKYLLAALDAEAAKATTKYIVVQASKEDVQWTVQLRAACYSAGVALSKDLLEEWHEANPNGFSIIKERNGPRIGHLDLLPIRPATLRQLLEGKITEREIRGDSLYSPEEIEKVKDIYCEGIIIRAPRGTSKSQAEMMKAVAMRGMLFHLTSVIRRISNPKNLQYVYAIAASDSGRDVLENLGFEVQLKGEYRQDKDDLFRIEYNTLMKRVGELVGRRL